MDWQQITALGIVALTAGLFIASRWFPRRPKWQKATHCGCSTSGVANPSRIIVRSCRGDARQTIIHRP
jgi:hypothetical protein